MKIEDFDYDLPKNLIAHHPAEPRDSSGLMVVERVSHLIKHRKFSDLPDLLTQNDVLVFNQSKVIPARLIGKKPTGGKVEILLLRELNEAEWECISKPGLKIGQQINLDLGLDAKVLSKKTNGVITLAFHPKGVKLIKLIEQIGLTPLPPYINPSQGEKELREIYQTVYANTPGSSAAPTAGLHFTKKLLERLSKKGVQMEFVTLHVGLGTFRPVVQEQLDSKKLHSEWYQIDKEVSDRLNKAKSEGKRIIAVGTTTTRVLESSSDAKGKLAPSVGETNIFIYPPYKYRFVDSLITNFHIPKSSLLMLVSAYVSKPNTNADFEDFHSCLIGKAYKEAVKKKYRFYSFGDAMLIV